MGADRPTMTGVSATMPFQAALAKIDEIHQQELDSQRVHYEKKLKQEYNEKEYYRSILAEAFWLRQLIALDQPSSRKKTEWETEPHQTGAEAGGSINTGTSVGAAAGVQPGAARFAAPAMGTAGAMLEGTVPAAANPEGPRWIWEVIGGEDKGGIVVREGEQTDSGQHTLRLATGSLVEETERKGDRLNFRRVTGAGPRKGWISTRVSGRDLVVRVDRPPLRPRQPPPVTVGPNRKPPFPTALLFMEIPLPSNILGMYKELSTVKEGVDMIGRLMKMDRFMFSIQTVFYMLPSVVCFIAGFAALEKLKGQRPEVVARAGAVAGSGVGQYVALCAAGVLSFEDGLQLVILRMMAVYGASELCDQQTLAVSHIEQKRIHLLCLQVCRMEGTGAICQISAYLSNRYFWVSGTSKAMELIEGMATEAGAYVERLWPLSPHTSLMKPALAEFTDALEEVLPRMKPPLYTVWMNATGEPVRPGADPADILADLKQELTVPMLVSQSIDAMRKESIGECYHVQLTTDEYQPIVPISSADWMAPLFAEDGKRDDE